MLRVHTDDIVAPLGRRDAVLLAVAQTNREYATLQRRMARARYEERKHEVVDLHLASQRLIRTGYPGNELPADDLNDALIDTLPVWLYQAFDRPSGDSIGGYDLTQIGVHALRAFSLEKTLSKLWQQCLWLDWRLSDKNKRLTLAPNDRPAETLRHAWLFRQQGISTQSSFIDLAAESAAKKANLKIGRIGSRTIIAQESRAGRRRKFITGRATNRSASYLQRHMWTSVETSYVGMFLDAPLPKLGLSCHQLQKVWCVVSDACSVLAKKCADSRPVDTATIRDWALACSRSDLSEAIAASVSLSSEDIEAALAFLTYDGSDFRRGVWSMPLIQLPGTKILLMCRSPLEIGNPVRRVEQWLERGGLSDQLSGAKRGNSYETWVRDEIASCLKRNRLLNDVASIISPIKPADRSIGDIDAAFRIKDLVVVIEIKCLLTPAEPIEQYRYRNKLDDAAEQAIRKATWLATNIEAHRSDLRLTGTEPIEIKPVVLTNHGYGLSLEIDGCLICDFHTLSNYLGGNTVVVGGAFSGITGEISYTEETLYRDEEGARRGLLGRIRGAPTLKRYVDRTVWGEAMIPCFNPPSDTLAVSGARLSEAVDPAAKMAALSLRPGLISP
jgi:hypothetical protein